MALLNQLKKYIQLKEDGVVNVYESLEKRLKEKLAPSPEKIIEHYDSYINTEVELMTNYLKEKGIEPENLTEEEYETLITTDPFIVEHSEIANKWGLEKFYYEEDIRLHQGCTHDFPLMSEVIRNIKDSIPHIIEQHHNEWKGKTLLEIYKEAKEKFRFGETEDC